MAEWSIAAVLKTVEDASPPGVRIPLSPPRFSILKTELAYCQTRNTVTLAHCHLLTALVAALVKRGHDRAVAGIAAEGGRDAAQDGLQFLTALAVLAGVYLPHPGSWPAIEDFKWRGDCNLAKKRVKYAPNDFIYLEGSSAPQLQWT